MPSARAIISRLTTAWQEVSSNCVYVNLDSYAHVRGPAHWQRSYYITCHCNESTLGSTFNFHRDRRHVPTPSLARNLGSRRKFSLSIYFSRLLIQTEVSHCRLLWIHYHRLCPTVNACVHLRTRNASSEFRSHRLLRWPADRCVHIAIRNAGESCSPPSCRYGDPFWHSLRGAFRRVPLLVVAYTPAQPPATCLPQCSCLYPKHRQRLGRVQDSGVSSSPSVFLSSSPHSSSPPSPPLSRPSLTTFMPMISFGLALRTRSPPPPSSP